MTEKLLNITQAAEQLNMSVTTLRRLCKAKKIGFYGGRNQTKRFSALHIEQYLGSVEQGREVVVIEQSSTGRVRRKKVNLKIKPRADHYFAKYLI